MRYQFRRGVPAISAEIYLPKKAGFQGPVYSALTEGRDPEKVRDHFRKHRKRVNELLRADWPDLGKLDAAFIDGLADNIRDIFRGYSMYEVDGVFFSEDDAPAEERSQVIRLVFEYPVADDESNEFVAEVKRFFRAPNSSLKHYAPSDEQFREGLKTAELWVKRVGAFLFGFVMHRIELAILGDPRLRQQEIWLTSWWNATINKFVPGQGG